MAVIKVACPKCGQRVSGDESFYGTTVECPICTSTILFPEAPGRSSSGAPAASSSSSPAEGSESPGKPTRDPEPRRETSAIPLPPRKSGNSPDPVDPEDLPSPVLGVVSMVLGIVSVSILCIPGIILGPAAIICGHLARARARHAPVASPPGHGAALIGLVLGYLSLVGFIVLVLGIGPAMEWLRSTSPPQ